MEKYFIQKSLFEEKRDFYTVEKAFFWRLKETQKRSPTNLFQNAQAFQKRLFF